MNRTIKIVVAALVISLQTFAFGCSSERPMRYSAPITTQAPQQTTNLTEVPQQTSNPTQVPQQTSNPTEIPQETTSNSLNTYTDSAVMDYGNGYSGLYTLTIWDPLSIDNRETIYHPYSNEFSISTNDYDPVKDAVIPVMLSIKNTTEGFDLENADTQLSFFSTSCSDSGLIDQILCKANYLDVITYTSEGNSSVDYIFLVSNDYMFSIGKNESLQNTNGNSWKPIPSGEERTSLFFVIIHDYYTPERPNGLNSILPYLVVSGSEDVLPDHAFSFSGHIVDESDLTPLRGE